LRAESKARLRHATLFDQRRTSVSRRYASPRIRRSPPLASARALSVTPLRSWQCPLVRWLHDPRSPANAPLPAISARCAAVGAAPRPSPTDRWLRTGDVL